MSLSSIEAPVVVYYVSGHGFGHATRSLVVAERLAELRPGATIHFRTVAPDWLFQRMDPKPAKLTVTPVAADVGVVQTDGLRFGLGDTLQALDRFERDLPDLEKRELHFLRASRANLVISDISPFPLAWASRAGIPGVAIGNFGWDAIYRGFAKQVSQFEHHAELFAKAYQEAGLLLKLPHSLPMDAFPHSQEIPLVVRKPRTDAGKLRRELRAGGRKVVFLSFGGFGVSDLPIGRLRDLPDFLFVVGERLGARNGSARNIRAFDAHAVDHVAMVQAADVILGKPGYGLVAEVTAYQRRIVYTSRGRFPEYRVLAAALRRTGQAVFCPRRALASGDLRQYIEKALSLPETSRHPPRCDGALVAARILASLMR